MKYLVMKECSWRGRKDMAREKSWDEGFQLSKSTSHLCTPFPSSILWIAAKLNCLWALHSGYSIISLEFAGCRLIYLHNYLFLYIYIYF